MAAKSANVSARVEPEIKERAEAILLQLGLPVSVVIETLYRQIILTGGIPYSLTLPSLPTQDTMSAEQMRVMLENGYDQSEAGQGLTLASAFAKLRED